MDRKDKELLKRLLPMFKIEAHEHLTIISSGLIEIEKADPGKQAEIVETIYRESHSFKGAARSVNLPDIVAICQSMENVFSAIKRGEITPSTQLLDLLHETIDWTSRSLASEDFSDTQRAEIKTLVQRLENVTHGADHSLAGQESPTQALVGSFAAGSEKSEREPTITSIQQLDAFAPSEATATLSPSPPITRTIRISTAKLDSLLLQAEEMLSIKLATSQRAAELKDLKNTLDMWRGEITRRKSSRAVPGPGRIDSDADSLISSLEPALAKLMQDADYDRRSFEAMLDTLLHDMKQTLMLPFSSLFEMFPKLVRELAKDAGKEAALICEGGEVEVDRRVLEEIKDPLVHLVRNCIDHGIEKAPERIAKKKPPRGTVRIAVSSFGGKIEISVSDDGGGIDISKVSSAAEKSGAISRREADGLSERDALLLIFRSGISTSPIITDISGRGLGLAIVSEKVEKLNGAVTIDTRRDAGTTLKIVAPITLSTFRGVLVSAGEQLFVLPLTNVERVARVHETEIQTVENRETLCIDGHTVALARLDDVLEIRSGQRRSQTAGSFIQFVVLVSAGKRMAFLVDEVLHELEVLVKNLGRQLARVRNITGATILGNGKVAPILNVSDLMKSAIKTAPSTAAAIAEPERYKSVLVVEDSITARALLKIIVESAGYNVQTAVDGAEAFSILKTQSFDLVVSDVDMPRMSGFELTAKIRADKDLSELPVVLVTALESRVDKERGIDVGADAYIVKSSFEQSNLLEAIRRLI